MQKHSKTIEEDQRRLTLIQQGDNRTLEVMYKEFRNPFIRWASHHYSCSEESAAEVYQKAFIVFYNNVRNQRLTTLTSRLQTYLFGIGRRVILEFLRKERNNTDSLESISEIEHLDMGYAKRESKNHLENVVGDLLNRIDGNCKKVLVLFYYKNFTMESIAENMNYSNAAVAKKKKYACLKKLRDLVGSSNLSTTDLLADY